MLEKIKNLQWHYQLLLLVGIATLLYLSVWYFVTSVTREEVRVKNEEIAVLEAKNEAARVATQRINEFRALYASKSVEYEELKVLLPEQREITNVLQGLQDNARDSRMIVMRFSPRDDTQQDVIMAKPVEIAQLVATVVRLADVDSAGPVPIEARRREPPNSRG